MRTRLAKGLIVGPDRGDRLRAPRERGRSRRRGRRKPAALPYRRQPHPESHRHRPVGRDGRPAPGAAAPVHDGRPPRQDLPGKVMFINPAVNEADRSVRVIAEVNNALRGAQGRTLRQGTDRHREPRRGRPGAPRGPLGVGCRRKEGEALRRRRRPGKAAGRCGPGS